MESINQRFWDNPANGRGASSDFSLHREAFSILELLVAMVVLAIILVMVSQIVSGVLASTRTQNTQMDSVAEARRALDVMESDLRSAIVGRTVTVLVPDATTKPVQLSFATARRGPDSATSTHRFLGVSYLTNADNALMRRYRSLASSDSDLLNILATSAGSASTTNLSVIGEGILAWQVLAVQTNGMIPIGDLLAVGAATTNYHGVTPPAGWAALATRPDPGLPDVTPVKTLEIWIAAVGPESLRLIESTGAGPAILTALSGEPSGWRVAIDESAGIPGVIKSSIRVLKKSVPLP